jgi:hypothetical protein
MAIRAAVPRGERKAVSAAPPAVVTEPKEPPILAVLSYFRELRACAGCGDRRVLFVTHYCPAGEVRDRCKPCALAIAEGAGLTVHLKSTERKLREVWERDRLPKVDAEAAARITAAGAAYRKARQVA